MTLQTTTILAFLFAALAIANASLMAWLWRFPIDAEGRTTAPKSWRMLHRTIGYIFAGIYLCMLPTMLPRLWQYQEFTWASWLHAGVALVLAPLLLFKVLVVRNVIPLGAKLPWIGGAVLVTALIVVGAVAPPSIRLQSGPPSPGKAVATTRCLQCHGPSRVLTPHESWSEIAEEMVERAQKTGRKLTPEEAHAAVGYLRQFVDSGKEGEEGREDSEDRNGRGKGRGRGGRD